MQDPHSDNHGALLEEIEDQDKWKEVPYSFIGRLHVIKL